MKLEIVKNIQGGKMSLLAGTVTACREGSGASAGKVVNVKLAGKVWNPDIKAEEDKEIEIAFWNNDDGSRMLADRVMKAKVGVGSFITALVVMKEDGKTATGINFKYSGQWKFAAQDGQKEMNVFVGTVASMDEDSEGRFVKVSMPVAKNADVTEWHRITLWNNDTAKLADRAKVCLKPRQDGRKVRAIVVCGETAMFNDKPTYTGYRFEIIPEADKK